MLFGNPVQTVDPEVSTFKCWIPTPIASFSFSSFSFFPLSHCPCHSPVFFSNVLVDTNFPNLSRVVWRVPPWSFSVMEVLSWFWVWYLPARVAAANDRFLSWSASISFQWVHQPCLQVLRFPGTLWGLSLACTYGFHQSILFSSHWFHHSDCNAVQYAFIFQYEMLFCSQSTRFVQKCTVCDLSLVIVLQLF